MAGNTPPPETEPYRRMVRSNLHAHARSLIQEHGLASSYGVDAGKVKDIGLRLGDGSAAHLSRIKLSGLRPVIKIHRFHSGKPEGLVTACNADRPGEFSQIEIDLSPDVLAKAQAMASESDLESQSREMMGLHLGSMAIAIELMRLREAGVQEEPMTAADAVNMLELLKTGRPIAP